MSWATFKSNILDKANSPENIDSIEFVANLWATEYDKAIKAGKDLLHMVSLQNGNTAVMENLFKIALYQGQASNSPAFSLVTEFGKGVQAYWAGGIMNNYPIPIIPAPGSVQNIAVISNLVTSPGVWTPQPPIRPTDNTGLIVDQFILAATIHLTTVAGVVQTTSLYPAVPSPIPAPGILPWTGYMVPPSTPSVGIPAAAAVALAKIENVSDTTLSTEQVESFTEERNAAQIEADSEELSPEEREPAAEYVTLKNEELEAGKQNAADVDLTEEEVDALAEITDEKCPVGAKVVNAAKKDIGILETGTPPGLNYGGFTGGKQLKKAGRIDAMIGNTGLNNQAKVKSSGSGYYWCAGAVTTWWKEAGLPTPPGAAACANWKKWAKSKGYWSTKPVLGAAVIYSDKTGHAHHIGIVSAVLPNGSITTIEGNTGGGGFNRNGCGVFSKAPKKYDGFVIPPPCVKK
jgi:surface antigen